MAFPGISVRVNQREFQSTLRKYLQYTRRDWATIANTKAFYIARRAARETPMVDKGAMLKALRADRLKSKVLKNGKVKNTKYTLAQLIVMARQKPGESMSKAAIKEAAKKLIAARVRSRAFLKSGWLPAIKRLEPLAEKIGRQPPKIESQVAQIGRAKGNAKPARAGAGARASCSITNDALTKKRGNVWQRVFGGNRKGALKHAVPALQRAFDAETNSMKEYIAKKLAKSANQAGIKTH